MSRLIFHFPMFGNKQISNFTRLYFLGSLFIGAFLLQAGCKSKQHENGSTGISNHLKDEISPYLLQHVHNPVDWYPWKDEALELGLKSRKLMIVSIGYSSCHWCHVMERESFSDTAVSRIMNQNFISIKVDREERPDVDQVYMNACQIVNSGACGWPLNSITLPDGRPVWVGTYLTKEEWIKLLISIQNLYEEDPNELEKMAMRIQSHLSVDYSQFVSSNPNQVTKGKLEDIFKGISKEMDLKHGGKISSQKFPLPALHKSLMEYSYHAKNAEINRLCVLSLNKMAQGGIYDHLAGGFFRYTVDSEWKVPHFEKMLYDNAQLISLYSLAFQRYKEESFREVVKNSMNFVLNSMRHKEGLFYSSFDAESDGEEGKFYVWTENEIDQILSDTIQKMLFKSAFNITSAGNWEKGRNILFQTNDIKSVIKKNKLEESAALKALSTSKQKMLSARNQRTMPFRDEKMLCSWNGLMIKACADASAALQNREYLDAAIKAAEQLKINMYDPGKGLYRNFMNNTKSISAFLEDYAFSMDAFLRLYELTFDESYLDFSKELAEIVIKDFSDNQNVYFYFTSHSDRRLIARKIDFEDQVIPSANSVLAECFYKLGLYYYDSKYSDRAEKMILGAIQQFGEQQAEFYANWMRLGIFMLKPAYEIAIVGPKATDLRDQLASHYLPNAILLGGVTEGSLELLKEKLQEGKTYIYVCRNKVCKLPVTEVPLAIELLN
ncbi:MAG: thioredoxin domain-containing protein [Saprospiraceae bacterium]|nr:thioredoxin domain-containing protein [Saprospiraceae bacterium]